MEGFNANLRSNEVDAEYVSNLISDYLLHSIPLGETFHRENINSQLGLCILDTNNIVIDFWKSAVSFFSNGHKMVNTTIKLFLTTP